MPKTETIHGVFMNVFNTGVLIMGDAMSGKSELALALISLGHQLIADDAPQFEQQADKIVGKSSDLLKNHLHIRDLGFLAIDKLYGCDSIATDKRLELIINLNNKETQQQPDVIKQISQITLKNNNNRYLPPIIEAAVLNYQLQQSGHDTNIQFIKNHRQTIISEKHE